MRDLHVDLMPSRKRFGTALLAWPLAATGLLTAAWFFWAESRADELAATVHQLYALEQGRSVAETLSSTPPADMAHHEDAQALAEMANCDADAALRAVEALQTSGVRLTSINLTSSDCSSRAEFELTRLEQLADVLQQLNAGEPLARWQIAQIRAGSSGMPNLATLTAKW